jgi:hypothetical protein
MAPHHSNTGAKPASQPASLPVTTISKEKPPPFPILARSSRSYTYPYPSETTTTFLPRALPAPPARPAKKKKKNRQKRRILPFFLIPHSAIPRRAIYTTGEKCGALLHTVQYAGTAGKWEKREREGRGGYICTYIYRRKKNVSCHMHPILHPATINLSSIRGPRFVVFLNYLERQKPHPPSPQLSGRKCRYVLKKNLSVPGG